jgi:hypothetical protein
MKIQKTIHHEYQTEFGVANTTGLPDKCQDIDDAIGVLLRACWEQNIIIAEPVVFKQLKSEVLVIEAYK